MTGPTRQHGRSLVELMVAITIAVILLAGVIEVFISAKQGYRIQESTSILQENARFAMRDLNRYINMADYWGGVEGEDVVLHADLDDHYSARGNCDFAWAMDPQAGVFGYDGNSTAPGPTDCLPSNYVPNTDVLVIRSGIPDDYAPTADLEDDTNTDLDEHGAVYVRSLVGAGGFMFHRSTVADAKSRISGSDDEGIFNHRFELAILYLADFDVGGTTMPTLSVLDLDTRSGKAALWPYQLVEGVEQMQLSYGIDLDGDSGADIWKNATAVTADEWDDVIIIRVGLMVRGRALDDFTDTTTYAMPGDFSFTPAAANARFQRRLLVRDIQIRNRVRE